MRLGGQTGARAAPIGPTGLPQRAAGEAGGDDSPPPLQGGRAALQQDHLGADPALACAVLP